MAEQPVLERTQRRQKNLWVSNFATLGLLAVFIAAAFAVEGLLKPTFTPTLLLLTGVGMALVPAAVWIYFFYRQDRREPEPKGMVLQVFLLGGLLAAAVSVPLLELFNLHAWITSSAIVNLLGGILVVGFTQEFLKFAAVRFSVYPSSEFDERTDGIIYATAAGLGFATLLNINFVVSSGGVNLGMGATRVVLTALAQASFAGITGYFLAREKLDNKPAWWMPVGLALAALLNGVFFYLWGNLSRGRITVSGGFVNPWTGLALAAVIAAVTTYILSALIDRDQRRAHTADPAVRKTPPLAAWLAVGLAVLAILAGWALKGSVENRTRPVEHNGVQAALPAGWLVEKGLVSERMAFTARDPLDNTLTYTATLLPTSAETRVTDLVVQRNLERGQKLTSYRVLDQSAVILMGREAYKVHFAYIDPRSSGELPLVIEGVDFFFFKEPKALVATLEEEASLYEGALPGFMKFLASLSY